MDVVLDSNVIGSYKHLLFSKDGFLRLDKIPENAWHFSGKIKEESTTCLDSVFRLNFVENSPKIPARYVKSMEISAPGYASIPWSMVLPKHEYRRYFDSLINYIKENRDIDLSYYENAWIVGNRVLQALRPAKIDNSKIQEILEASAIQSHVVETFRPRAGGYASPIKYDRFGTVTGRLTVESGPNILLLKREHRSMIKSSYVGGKIISIDFSSLEARVLLYESGNDCQEFDLYGMLAERFGGMSRNLVKAAVLSVLYGSSRSAVALTLGISETKVSEVIKQIEKYINTKTLIKALKKQHAELGFIMNRHGRKIKVDRPQDNIFISYYAQSTGVDVSLIGFSKILDSLGTNGIRPLFVLHDALILDVHPDRLKDVTEITKINVPGYDQMFPLKIEEISR